MLSLYEKIDSLCKQKGTNITKMCKEAGVSRSILSDYKAGRTKDITTDSLKKIATYLNISTDYLLGNDQKEKPAQAQTNTSELDQAFFQSYEKCTG